MTSAARAQGIPGPEPGASARLRAVVTNDDGIASYGLVVLAEAAREAGFDILVAAPVRESSGTSAGLTAAEEHGAVTAEQRTLPGLPGIPAYSVSAHPAFIALAAAQGAFGPPPHVVLSGVNYGANLGRAILHSGTVGAALTAALQGARSLAVSLAIGTAPPDEDRWEAVRAVLRATLPLLVDLPPCRTINVNVPDRPLGELGELVRCPLARTGTVQARIEHRSRGELRRVTAPLPSTPEPGTDAAELLAGNPTISEIQPVDDVAEPALPEELPSVLRHLSRRR